MLFIGMFDHSTSRFGLSEIEALKTAVSREPNDVRKTFLRPHFALVTVDFGNGSAFRVDEKQEGIGLVCGRPYLHADAASDTSALTDALRQRDRVRLSKSRGSFCGLYFDQADCILRLCTDKVGVYPIYIAVSGSRVFFSNALRMLDALPEVPKQIAPDRLFTSLAFEYCLGKDTVFAGIDRMYGGEMIEFSRLPARSEQYWDWNAIRPQNYTDEALTDAVHQAFSEAIALRVDAAAPGELSFLSGGLDSRCIVAGLRAAGRKVWTLNFAPEGSQDHLFGRLAAQALGAAHFELVVGKDSFARSQKRILDAWATAHPQLAAAGVRPCRVWSGDGGSVGLGHVYLDEEFLRLLRKDAVRQACQHFIDTNNCRLSLGMLRPEMREKGTNAPLSSMEREIRRFSNIDPAKSGFLFLLLNDQRNHLADYFENLDICKFEFVLPFFDSALLEIVVAAPIEKFLRHALYSRWLEKFGAAFSSVPWQTYPGHVPCPVPIENYPNLRYQWDEDWFDEAELEQKWAEDMRHSASMLRSRHFSNALLSKKKIWMAYWLTRLKIRNYKYVLDSARKIMQYTSGNRLHLR